MPAPALPSTAPEAASVAAAGPPQAIPARTAANVRIVCNSAAAACPPLFFGGAKAGSDVVVYSASGTAIKSIVANPSGVAAWDETDQSGLAAPSGSYFAFVLGSRGTKWVSISLNR